MKNAIISIIMLMAVSGIALAVDQDFCATSGECSDGNDCTTDYCGTTVNMLAPGQMDIVGGYCQSVKAPDGTICSTGKCSNGFCTRVHVAHARGSSKASDIQPEVIASAQVSSLSVPDNSVPEFSAVAAGLAFAGAGFGYAFVRKFN